MVSVTTVSPDWTMAPGSRARVRITPSLGARSTVSARSVSALSLCALARLSWAAAVSCDFGPGKLRKGAADVAPSMFGDAKRRANAARQHTAEGGSAIARQQFECAERKRRSPGLKTIGKPGRLSSSNIGPSRAHRLTAKPLFRYSKMTDGRGQPELSDQQDLGRLLAQIPGCRLLAPRMGRRGRNSPRAQSNPGRTGQSEGRRTSRTARQDGG